MTGTDQIPVTPGTPPNTEQIKEQTPPVVAPVPPVAAPVPPITPPQVATTPKADLVGDALLNKIRADEKSKHQSMISALQAEKAALAQEKDELSARVAIAEKAPAPVPAAPVIGDTTATEIEELRQQVRVAEQKTDQTQQTMNAVAEEATLRIRTQELDTYREKLLRDHGISHTADLVMGSSEAELDAATVVAKAKQEAIIAAAEAEVKKQLGVNVPEPLSPSSGPEGFANTLPLNTKDRASLVRERDPRAYAERKAELLAAAKLRIGER